MALTSARAPMRSCSGTESAWSPMTTAPGDGALAELEPHAGVAGPGLHDRRVAQLRPALAVAAGEALEVGVRAGADGADDRGLVAGEPGDVERLVLLVGVHRLGGHVEAGDAGPWTRPSSTAPPACADRWPVDGLGDVAGRVDVVVARAQVLVDEDPAVAGQAGRLGESDARAHADGDGDDLAGDLVAVAGLDGHDPAVPADDAGELREVWISTPSRCRPPRRCATRTRRARCSSSGPCA